MRALVTGGTGFLGAAIVRELLARGAEVTAISRSAPSAIRSVATNERLRAVAVDLTDARAVAHAVHGHDTIFHVAAKTGVWGSRASYFGPNVLGTRNVLAAALSAGVPRLVHTSSPSVCFDGTDHVRAGNELPYASRFLCAYPETKAIAERQVLAANGTRGSGGVPLVTCALRPHLVVGPGDPHLVPRLVERARLGRLPIIGDGTNEVSLTDVDNAALAHVEAALRLAPDAPHAGRAYFIAQSEPVRIWDWLNHVLRELGVPSPTRRVSRRAAYAGGALCEALWRLLPLGGEPPMTRFVALQLAGSHSYDLAPARRDFGYEERIDLESATERIVDSMRDS